jgi:hypothetical protein
MCVKTKKYWVSISFCPKLSIFGKTVGQHLWILSKNLSCFKTHKNSYTGLLCITYPGYGCQNQEILSFGQFMHKLAIFVKTVVLYQWISIKIWVFFKTHKKSYMGPLCITDPEYGGHGQEIRSFGKFMPQTSDFR